MTDEELPNLYSGLPDRRLLRIASNWVAQAITVPAKSGLIGVPQTLLEEMMRRLDEGTEVPSHKPLKWTDGVDHPLPWRQGRSVLRTIYDANEVLIGVMDTAELATQVVVSVNLAAIDMVAINEAFRKARGDEAP